MAEFAPARLYWGRDGVPRSIDYDDIYYSAENGLAESRYVFCDAIAGDAGLQWWRQKRLTIAETGFGSGLNFLASWQKWETSAPAGGRLHFVAVEKHPMTSEMLAQAHENWPELAAKSAELIDKYPALHPGFHRLQLAEGRISLTLLFGEAGAMLKCLDARIDGWYLDGFAPSKNPEMWRPDLFVQIARLSGPNCRLCTFSAAGAVRRGLERAGFRIIKRPGYGRKRECLYGRFEGNNAREGAPWFRPPPPLAENSRIAIIGAGVAGVSCYLALEKAGFRPFILESRQSPGLGGSGNPRGLIQPRLSATDSLEGRFNASSFLYALRFFDQLEKKFGTGFWQGRRGGIQIARNQVEEERYKKIAQTQRLPATEIQFLDSRALSQKAGIPLKKAGLYFPSAGVLAPDKLVTFLASELEITTGFTVEKLRYEGGFWHLEAKETLPRKMASAVIFANAHQLGDLFPVAGLSLTAKRGQVSYLPANDASGKLACGLSFGAYVTPAFERPGGMICHLAGASYQALNQDERYIEQLPLQADHLKNLSNLNACSSAFSANMAEDDLKALSGRAAIRATTIDHWPVMGAIHDGRFCVEIYHDLHHGKPERNYPDMHYITGLYCLTGLGSRGLQTAPFLAEALADRLSGTPNLLEKDFLNALHPARFQIRDLRRRKT